MSKPPRTRPAVAQAEADIAFLMQQAAFRRWFLTVLGKSGFLVANQRADSHATSFDLGRRSLGLELLLELDGGAGGDALLWLMQEEALNRANQPQEDPDVPEDA